MATSWLASRFAASSNSLHHACTRARRRSLGGRGAGGVRLGRRPRPVASQSSSSGSGASAPPAARERRGASVPARAGGCAGGGARPAARAAAAATHLRSISTVTGSTTPTRPPGGRLLPYLSVESEDGCAGAASSTHLPPHDAAMLHVITTTSSRPTAPQRPRRRHEVFAITVDPGKPAPRHRGGVRGSPTRDACEVESNASPVTGSRPATPRTSRQAVPFVYPSKDKHATYVRAESCLSFTTASTAARSPTPRPRRSWSTR